MKRRFLPLVFGVAVVAAASSCRSDSVFEGVSRSDLTDAGITVTDYHPQAEPGLSEQEMRALLKDGMPLTKAKGQLVLVRLDNVDGERLAWAFRVAVQWAFKPPPGQAWGWAASLAPGTETAILFLEADSGEQLALYQQAK